MVSRGTGRAFGNDGDDTLGMVTPYSPEDLASCEDVAEGSHLDKLENGWVLLFAPGSEEEGVYTVQDDEDITFVVAFEAKEDAMRFAQQLEAEDFELPSVCQWSMDMLTDFCEMGDYTIGLVPEGVRARAVPRVFPSCLLWAGCARCTKLGYMPSEHYWRKET